MIHTLILQSRLALITGDLDEAMKILEQAKRIAQEKGLHLINQKANEELIFLEKELDKWQMMIRRNAPIAEKLNLARLEEYVNNVKKTLNLNQ